MYYTLKTINLNRSTESRDKSAVISATRPTTPITSIDLTFTYTRSPQFLPCQVNEVSSHFHSRPMAHLQPHRKVETHIRNKIISYAHPPIFVYFRILLYSQPPPQSPNTKTRPIKCFKACRQPSQKKNLQCRKWILLSPNHNPAKAVPTPHQPATAPMILPKPKPKKSPPSNPQPRHKRR